MEASISVDMQRLVVAILAISAGSLFTWIAWGLGFLTLSKTPLTVSGAIKAFHVAAAFAIFLAIEVVIVPSLYHAWIGWEFGPKADSTALDTFGKGWLNLTSIGATFVMLAAYLWRIKPEVKLAVFGIMGYGAPFFAKVKCYLVGAVSWLVIYPWVLALGQLIELAVSFFYQGPEIDQLAVKHLKDIFLDLILFTITVVAVVTIIPFMEELLFRGFLQTYLIGLFGRWPAIVATSIIFALFHFSGSQGVDNIELITSLFAFSCFLGFVRERTQSLWGSVGLHSIFNFLSILMLIISEQ